MLECSIGYFTKTVCHLTCSAMKNITKDYTLTFLDELKGFGEIQLCSFIHSFIHVCLCAYVHSAESGEDPAAWAAALEERFINKQPLKVSQQVC